MTGHQAVERQAAQANLVRELVEALRVCYCIAAFQPGDAMRSIQETAKQAIDLVDGAA